MATSASFHQTAYSEPPYRPIVRPMFVATFEVRRQSIIGCKRRARKAKIDTQRPECEPTAVTLVRPRQHIWESLPHPGGIPRRLNQRLFIRRG